MQNAGSSAIQRGKAAQIRQMNDNGMPLPKKDRQFLNVVIHDKSLDHNEKFEQKLTKLTKKHGGS